LSSRNRLVLAMAIVATASVVVWLLPGMGFVFLPPLVLALVVGAVSRYVPAASRWLVCIAAGVTALLMASGLADEPPGVHAALAAQVLLRMMVVVEVAILAVVAARLGAKSYARRASPGPSASSG
jgi:hypothetical protein